MPNTPTMHSGKPLDGMRVLDLTHLLAGPYCTQLLADLGADVVKVEPPQGESSRHMAQPGDSEGRFSAFDYLNRNKRALAIDIRDARGAAVLRRLARSFDVLVENYRPEALERAGLGYEELRRENQGLIYCSVSGFGRTGPYSDRGGFDLVAQAMSGLMTMTGSEGGEPNKVGVPIADLNAGVFAALAVVVAWTERLRSGQGQFLDASLLDCALAYTVTEAGLYWSLGQIAAPTGSAHRLMAPYEAIRAKDGHVIVAAATTPTWAGLVRALGSPRELMDPAFATGVGRLKERVRLRHVLEELFVDRAVGEIVYVLAEQGVPSGPVYTIDQALQDPHVLARGTVTEIHGASHPYLAFPVHFSRTKPTIDRMPPRLGEQSTQVLREGGLIQSEIDELIDAGVVVDGS